MEIDLQFYEIDHMKNHISSVILKLPLQWTTFFRRKSVVLKFKKVLKEHEGRIHYQIHRLGIPSDLYDDFYAEGLITLWKAYKNYDPEEGDLGTYLNYRIRFRLIDLLRKKVRQREADEEVLERGQVELHDGNRHRTSSMPLVNPEGISLEKTDFWQEVRKPLTERQWKWVKYFIIQELSIKEIQELEGVSEAAVKSWGREVRRKLGDEKMRQKLIKLL